MTDSATQAAEGCILLVDDDEPLLALTTRLLRRLGYEVAGFTDADAALAAFREQPAAFDLVITDLTMPQRTGFEIVRAVHDTDPQTPVAITSGFVRPEDVASAHALGACALLRKPDTLHELTELLGGLCRDHRRRRA